MSQVGKVSLVVGTVLATAAVSYLAVFDYRRRNSAKFRNQLRKKSKKFQRAVEKDEAAREAELRDTIAEIVRTSIKEEELPNGVEEREKYFLSKIAEADEYSNSDDRILSALSFYHALRVYPSPTDLLSIYDKSVKKPILDLVVLMVQLEPPAMMAGAGGVPATGAGVGLD